MKKNSVFNLSGISIIACDCLQAIITIFVDLFFISRILNVDADGNFDSLNIIKIATFYLVLYAVLAVSYAFSGHFLKKINKSIYSIKYLFK